MFRGSRTDLARRLERVELKLDAVIAHLGVQTPGTELSPEIRDLIVAGKKIEAIKRYCDETGASLEQGKAVIDRASR